MLNRLWFDALKSRFTRTPTRQERRASGQRGPSVRHLRLEPLEDRRLLAFLAPVAYSAAGQHYWDDAGLWERRRWKWAARS